VGRNEPCPCGSGRKYKKCHLEADQAPRLAASAVESVHQMDFRLVKGMAQFASSRFGPDWLGVYPEEENESALELILPWAVWTAEAGGQSVAAAYLEAQRPHLSPEEREWFDAQRASWMSIWETVAVEPGKIEVRDLLTGETRSVREQLASRTVVARDTLLARVIDYRGASYFGGMHRQPLPPTVAAAVVDGAREKLRLRKAAVPPDRLRSEKIGWLLIDWWNAVADQVEQRGLGMPDLINTDGDPLQFVTDSYGFDLGVRAEIERRIGALDDCGGAHQEGDRRDYVFIRAADDAIIGTVRVGRGSLEIETNSVNRADEVARRVEETCADILGARRRKTRKPSRLHAVPDTPDEPLAEASPEQQAILRKVKEEHYRKWLDMPIPALGDQTPRAAARSAKSWQQLDLMLREIENIESRVPEEARFDVVYLRRELGLESR
jgi:hypothetical protein